jgi:hypothetical protein
MTKPAPPSEILSALQAALPDFIHPDDPMGPSLLQSHETHEVFSLGLGATAKDMMDLPQSATSVGWRFIGADPTSDIGCQVRPSKANGKTGPRLMGLARTPEAQIILSRMRQLDEHMRKPYNDPPPGWPKPMPNCDFQLRALRIPGLFIEAVWLYNKDNPKDDHIVPLAGFPEKAGLVLMQAYPVDKFFDQARQAAKDRIKNLPDEDKP